KWAREVDAVSTGSGSDSVAAHQTTDETRSLPLPVLTSSTPAALTLIQTKDNHLTCFAVGKREGPCVGPGRNCRHRCGTENLKRVANFELSDYGPLKIDNDADVGISIGQKELPATGMARIKEG